MRIRFDDQQRRWELLDGDQVVGVADRVDHADVVVLPHVEVDPSRRGHGLAADLVTYVLGELRGEGKRIVPRCPYVAGFIRQHPEYADMVATA